MTVSTALPGRPEEVHALATWLRTSLARRLDDAGGALRSTAGIAESGWEGDAGAAFRGRAARAGRHTTDLATTVSGAARAVEEWATALSAAQAELGRVRTAAAAAGLTVEGDDVVAPAAVAPAGAADAARWDRLQQAYSRAAESVDTVGRRLREFDRSVLQNMVNDVRSKPLLVAGDFVGAGAAGAVEYRTTRLAEEAGRLRDRAGRAAERLRTAPPGTRRAVLDRDLRYHDEFRASARELDGRAARLASTGDRWLGRAGGALAVAGVAWDIAHGKPADQAIVSGAAGFGASVAAGAVIGTLVPVPVLGTVLGALGGAAVGLFTSGMVDSLYEHGLPDVDRAAADGWAAVTGTAGTIGELTTEAWDALF